MFLNSFQDKNERKEGRKRKGRKEWKEKTEGREQGVKERRKERKKTVMQVTERRNKNYFDQNCHFLDVKAIL